MRKFLRGLVATTAFSVAAVAAPAGAVTGSPPIPGDDHYTLRAGQLRSVNLLLNDADPDGDNLAICRVRNVPKQLFVDVEGRHAYLGGSEPGTFTFTYYACDYSYLVPATVTVTVLPPPRMAPLVHASIHPGKVRVANRGQRGFHFLFGSFKASKPDGEAYVAPHTSKLVAVRRTSLVWVAMNTAIGYYKVGVVRGVKIPAGVHELPPGAPKNRADARTDFRAAARGVVGWIS
ncbi:Ig-like domain-containing protein [Nocardioides montaniterrae]